MQFWFLHLEKDGGVGEAAAKTIKMTEGHSNCLMRREKKITDSLVWNRSLV